MPIIVGDIFRRVQVILNDSTSVRWPLPELLRWVNDCPDEIALVAPEILGRTGVMTLVAGTLQSLPSDAHSLIRITCNITGTDPNYVRGRAVTPIKRTVLERQIPSWMDSTVLPYNAIVSHLVEDDQVQGTFMIAPGNNGSGKIEVVVARRVANVAEPGTPLVVTSYDASSLDLDAAYLPAVVDYVCSRALQKDMAIPSAAQRAIAHYQQFQTALGVKLASETRVSTNTQEAGA